MRYSRVCVLLLDRRLVYANGGSGMSSGMEERTVAAHRYSSSLAFVVAGHGDGDNGAAPSSGCRIWDCGGGWASRSTDVIRNAAGTGTGGSSAAGTVAAVSSPWFSTASSRFVTLSPRSMEVLLRFVTVAARLLLPDDTTSWNHPRRRFRYAVSVANMSWPHGRETSALPPPATAVAALAEATAPTAPTP